MISRILFATDFAAVTRKAEDYALAIARAMGASVTMLHVVEPIEGADDEMLQKFLSDLAEKASVNAGKVATRFREANINADVRVEIGRRWEVIVDTAASEEYDLIVLGSHLIRDGKKVYIGSTTHKVFFAARTALLLVPNE